MGERGTTPTSTLHTPTHMHPRTHAPQAALFDNSIYINMGERGTTPSSTLHTHTHIHPRTPAPQAALVDNSIYINMGERGITPLSKAEESPVHVRAHAAAEKKARAHLVLYHNVNWDIYGWDSIRLPNGEEGAPICFRCSSGIKNTQ